MLLGVKWEKKTDDHEEQIEANKQHRQRDKDQCKVSTAGKEPSSIVFYCD